MVKGGFRMPLLRTITHTPNRRMYAVRCIQFTYKLCHARTLPYCVHMFNCVPQLFACKTNPRTLYSVEVHSAQHSEKKH